MVLLAAVAAVVAGAAGGSDLSALERVWPGVRDSAETVFLSSGTRINAWGEGAERRVRTIVSRLEAPAVGAHVLYMEEFLHDDPENVRRQLLLLLEPAQPSAAGVHVRVFTLRQPGALTHLDRRPARAATLRRADLAEAVGCDLLLRREGEQFIGGTLGNRCLDIREGGRRYVDLQLVISEDLYWYRRRVLLRANDDLLEEVSGYNWFELDEARLFSCRIDWSASGRRSELRPLLRTELHDEGGHAHFGTPDGRNLELVLHSQDWPFMADRDALILLLQDQDGSRPLATAWNGIDAEDIGIDLGWLRIHCGSLLPNPDALLAVR